MYREMVPPTDVLAHLAQALGALGVDHRSWSVQTAVYELVLRDPLCVERYGPSPTYCDAFAKLYVHQIESAARSKHMAVDVHDGLYEESARLFKAAVVYAKYVYSTHTAYRILACSASHFDLLTLHVACAHNPHNRQRSRCVPRHSTAHVREDVSDVRRRRH